MEKFVKTCYNVLFLLLLGSSFAMAQQGEISAELRLRKEVLELKKQLADERGRAIQFESESIQCKAELYRTNKVVFDRQYDEAVKLWTAEVTNSTVPK